MFCDRGPLQLMDRNDSLIRCLATVRMRWGADEWEWTLRFWPFYTVGISQDSVGYRLCPCVNNSAHTCGLRDVLLEVMART